MKFAATPLDTLFSKRLGIQSFTKRSGSGTRLAEVNWSGGGVMRDGAGLIDARNGERPDMTQNRPPKLVLIEPKPPGYHMFSKSKLPRLGTVLLGAIARDLGWEVHIYVEDIASIDYRMAIMEGEKDVPVTEGVAIFTGC